MKCKKGCTEVVHFISPEMSSLFDHAVVNMPDGSEKWFNITPPKKWRVKGHSFGATPIQAHMPITKTVFDHIDENGSKVYSFEEERPEIIYGSRYTGIDKRDQYFKDINDINRFVSKLTKRSDLLATDDPSQVSSHSDAPKPHHHKEG